jgi:glutamyl-Q tRNA(Asp) synthetase
MPAFFVFLLFDSMQDEGTYRGRFAPSPTGPLHFGSLVAALGSALRARSLNGQWLVRMEDLDPPREQAGAADAILRSLEAHGFQWDGAVMYQSQRTQAYLDSLDRLIRNGDVYPCGCTRKQIAAASDGRGIYPGTCRNGLAKGQQARALRMRTGPDPVVFHDRLQGPRQQCLETEVGDFIVRRADGLFAYQLAVVVDDAEQGITEVVRGSDLLDSTPRQIFLLQRLGQTIPDYLHLPVAVNSAGEKLSKQTHAPALDDKRPVPALIRALEFLGQRPPAELVDASVEELWRWAVQNWSLETVPAQLTLPAPVP